jgi:type IV secretory pathway VirD2 relaxase
MTRDDDLRVRPGRIRDVKTPRRARSFVAQALAATEKAGGFQRGGRRHPSSRSTFGRGRAATVQARARLRPHSRVVAIKARVVRQGTRGAPLSTHLAYLRRDGVTRDGTPGRVFDATGEADPRAFAERCEGDRHHFRFIVSPEDAADLSDLRAYTRDLMAIAERDLGTRLDWVAVDHWNTEHPHIHVLVRGRADNGENLVISRDYISDGLRARAAERATLELGPRTEQDIRRAIEREADAERWTGLDLRLVQRADRGIMDLRPAASIADRGDTALSIRRLRTLERLGLAEPAGPAQWRIADDLEPRLRAISERGDIIKRMHRELTGRGWDRGAERYMLDGDRGAVVGRLVARGLDDELKGTAFAIVDGIDGRAHHLRFLDLDATSDAAPGAVVELRHFTDAKGQERSVLAVRSDLSIHAQVTAQGATWLDHRLLDRAPSAVSGDGFGGEVRAALAARADHLVSEGLARRQGQRVVFARDLLDTLREREVRGAAARITAETGKSWRPVQQGDPVAGVFTRRLDLASGRFAMLDDGLGFQLVPWKPSMERERERGLGQRLAGDADELANLQQRRARNLSI